jgi:hypothetical protein
MSDTIRINPGNLTAAMCLHRDTCLAGSTKIDNDDAGFFIARNWPGLSSGEELVWACLAWMNGQGDLPDRGSLAATLDFGNLAVVMHYLAAAGVTA